LIKFSFLFEKLVLFPSSMPTIPHLSYDDAARARTIIYDNGAIQAWPSTDTPHYLSYQTSDLAHQTDQVHVWSDNATGGTYIQYLGKLEFIRISI